MEHSNISTMMCMWGIKDSLDKVLHVINARIFFYNFLLFADKRDEIYSKCVTASQTDVEKSSRNRKYNLFQQKKIHVVMNDAWDLHVQEAANGLSEILCVPFIGEICLLNMKEEIIILTHMLLQSSIDTEQIREVSLVDKNSHDLIELITQRKIKKIKKIHKSPYVILGAILKVFLDDANYAYSPETIELLSMIGETLDKDEAIKTPNINLQPAKPISTELISRILNSMKSYMKNGIRLLIAIAMKMPMTKPTKAIARISADLCLLGIKDPTLRLIHKNNLYVLYYNILISSMQTIV